MGDGPPHLVQFPARGLVLDGAAVFLEAGVALLAGYLLATVLVETHDCCTGPFRRRLAGHGIQFADKVVLVSQNTTELVQVSRCGARRVLPQPHAFVPDELRGPNRFVKSRELPLFALEFELQNHHAAIVHPLANVCLALLDCAAPLTRPVAARSASSHS